MAKLREELAAKGLPVSDEDAVLFAMFPRETEAYYKPAAAPAAAVPAPTPVIAQVAVTNVPAAPAAAVPASTGPVARYALTVNTRRYLTTVEELN